MNKDELLALRAEIVSRTRDIALEGDVSPSEKLEVLMNLIGSSESTPDLLRKAYELSGQLPEDSDKLDVMLKLLFFIDEQLSSSQDNQQPTTDSQEVTDSLEQ